MAHHQNDKNQPFVLSATHSAVGLLLLGLIASTVGHAQTKLSQNGQRNLSIQRANAPAASSEQRIALVIGNSAYKEAPLANPVNDARAIARALTETGFAVTIKENSDQKTMVAALREFGDKLRGGGTGLFYYAGHGMQIKGRNYLIPVGASIEREDEVAYTAIDAQSVLDKMESAGNAANIMILDACRNNPFIRSTRSGQAGLAQMDAPVGTLVAYATSPGAVASDGAGANGLYTQHLLKAMRQQGNKLEDVFKQVRAGVRRDSQGKQVPWESTSLEGDFYFSGPPLVVVPQDPKEAIENALWDAVKGSLVSVEIQAYLTRYPQGRYASEARAKLAALKPVSLPEPSKPTQVVAAAVPVQAPAQSPMQNPTVTPLHNLKQFPFDQGDRWNFAKLDVLKNEKSKFSYEVDQVDSNGTARVKSGLTRRVFANDGRLISFQNQDRARILSAGCKVRPAHMNFGFREPIVCTVDSEFPDGRKTQWVANGRIEAGGEEKVSTPAGEFMAYRVIRTLESKQSLDAAREEITYWYLDGMNFWIAQDYRVWDISGKLQTHEKFVLLDYHLGNVVAQEEIRENMLTAASFDDGKAGRDLGDFAVEPVVAPQRVASSTAQPANAKKTNDFGFAVGDQWRFQVVDKFKKEVIKNFGKRVTGIEKDGALVIDDGAGRWTPRGALLVEDYKDGYRSEADGPYAKFPTVLRAGATESVKFTIKWKQPGKSGVEKYDLTMKTVGMESVTVPAGTFGAWLVEITGPITAESTTGNGTGYLRQTCWYVPALLTYAACDRERRWGTRVGDFDRTELTSYNVQRAENLAKQ